VSVGEFDGLSGALAEVIQLCASCPSASDGPDIDDVGRMYREDSLDALVVYDSADGEGFVDAAAFAGYNGSGENLEALLVAFFDSAADVYGVAYFEMGYFFL